MSQASTDHPDPDLLADLAADELPREQALAVEQHVVGCPVCAGLLSDAEGVRGVLRTDPVGPMPADIAARLDAALQRESLWAADRTVESPAVGAPAADAAPAARSRRDRSAGDDSMTATGTFPKESFFDEPYPTAAIPAGSIPVSATGQPSRLRRADRSDTQRTRRQVRSEERPRPWLALLTTRPVLGIAAGLVGLVVLGAAVQQFTGVSSDSGGATSAASGSSAGAAPEAAPAVPVLETDTDYTSAELAAQAKALVARAASEQAAFAAARASASSEASAPNAAASGSGEDVAGGGTNDRSTPAPVAGTPSSRLLSTQANQLLRDPAALAACLTAIDSAGVRPVAVDLATYQGREAAILVLPAAAGGYEVWAVSRTCRPGADGTLLFTTVK